MIVSWNWLKDYLPMRMSVAELEHRLSMAGLNHESTTDVANDLAVDLEVTSNRPDCLGHLGVAREISVLWDQSLDIPDPQPQAHGATIADLTKVTIECPELCYRYTARVIRGVEIGPSPDWLASRLQTIGFAVINNVVDISNYVLMECGQPLHVFDFSLLNGPEIIVRAAHAGEEFVAIDHRQYRLEPGMCVIADTKRAIALGGVMGGVDSEVSDATTDLLIESAEFSPMSIRNTARKLNLHSPSSFRFERGLDPAGVDWASRRCCQLILDLAGGELAEGVLDVGPRPTERQPIVLRLSQLPRVLGIEVGMEEVRRILAALGNEIRHADPQSVEVTAPSWRRDLTREIDLVEEVARIHGYEQIPEDVGVPMAASSRLDTDRVQDRVRQVLNAGGFDESVTASVVPSDWADVFSPWCDIAPLTLNTPMLKGADKLRRSLVPSLLASRRINEAIGNDVCNLFETAHVYLPQDQSLPREQWTLAIVSGDGFLHVKGIVEVLLETLHVSSRPKMHAAQLALLDAERQGEMTLGNQTLGFIGDLSEEGLKRCGLLRPATIAELNLELLAKFARLVPQNAALSGFPAIARDLNLIVDSSLQWADLESTIRAAAGDLLESLQFQEVYRDAKKDGPDKKRVLFSITLRSPERTLTNEEADVLRQEVVTACAHAHKAELLG